MMTKNDRSRGTAWLHRLLVAVAELAAKGIHQIAENLILAGKAEGNAVGQRLLRRRRAVVQRGSAVDGILAVLGVQSLPDRPNAIDHCVVKEEDGVVGRGVEVLHLRRATAEPVAGAVDAELVVTHEALHLRLEVLDGALAEEELGDVGVGVVAAAEEDVQVAHEAARVEVVVVLDVVVVRAVEGAEVAEVAAGEGAGVNAATAGAGREGHVHEAEVGVVTVGDVDTIAAEGELVAVKDLALVGCVGIGGPVPVREVSGVAAGVDEIVLPLPDEVTVPGEEVGGDVDVHRHVDVGSDVLVVARLHTGVHAGIRSGRDLLQAHDSISEALAVLVRHLSELGADAGRLESAVTAELALLQALGGDLASISQSLAALNLFSAVLLQRGNVARRERGSGARGGSRARRDALGGRESHAGGETAADLRGAARQNAGSRVADGAVAVRGVRVRNLGRSSRRRGLDLTRGRLVVVVGGLGRSRLVGVGLLLSIVKARSAVGFLGVGCGGGRRKTRLVSLLEVALVGSLVGGRWVARSTTMVTLVSARRGSRLSGSTLR